MEEPAVFIVIDRSGSMGSGAGSRLENAKTEAKNIINKITEGTAVGIIAFDQDVSVMQSLTVLTESNRASMRGNVSNISSGGSTAIGDVTWEALQRLLNYGVENRTCAVYLLTDGESNSGREPSSVIPYYQANHIPIFSFGYELDDLTTLRELS